MATVFDTPTTHPVAAAVAAAEAALDQVAGLGFWSMTSTEVTDTLAAMHRLQAKTAALTLGTLHHAETLQIGPDAGATDTASWWAHQTRQTKRAAHHRMALAQALDTDHGPVRDAMATGLVSEEQATVIVRGVDALPVEHRHDAEAHLIEVAPEHDPLALRRLAEHILEVVAPEIAEDHERTALERQEALAEEKCRLTMSDDGAGTTFLRARIPTPVASMLRKALLANNAPKHLHHTGAPKGLGHAFCEYVTRYPIDRLPRSGGVAARIVVTMTLDQLLDRSEKPAMLDTGETLSIGQARKLACEAGIIPVVLGGKSLPLDAGRTLRLYTETQRIAMGIRDKHCTTEGCDWPAAMCHAHHNVPWSRGGKTNIADGRLLCPRHHSYAHSPKYEMKTIPNGRVIFSRT